MTRHTYLFSTMD
ncbi:hypothetical protein MTR67_034928 [Solanum verrucosum]|uniref:Uncharacterized protein n=1 Tax=Solanum verrucosum TaxID=315347 RepID=A0AAF0U8M9_SOLVR|nr:hypothetical protein MTR67_034928 [Solanum verrucosum]